MQPGADRLRDHASETPNPAGNPEDEQYEAEHQTCGGNFAWVQPICQDHRRDGFHRLDWHGQAVEQPGRDQEYTEPQQHPHGCQPGHGHRPDYVRDERAEVTTSAAEFA